MKKLITIILISFLLIVSILLFNNRTYEHKKIAINVKNYTDSQKNIISEIDQKGKKIMLSNVNYNHLSFPILYYHCVSDDIFGMDELFVSPEEFDNQMNYLYKNNFDVITFSDIANVNIYKKPIIITFDDGYENNYTEAYPILKKYNFKASIFLTYNFIGRKNYLSKKQITKMTNLINFQGHTLNHLDLRTLSKKELEDELVLSKQKLSDLTNQKINVFAYPTGYFNDTVIDMTKKNYDYAVTNQSGLFSLQKDNFLIKRIYIPRNVSIQTFSNKLH
ncbi:MAG: polysaccharide deacetylase family protein [Clostridiales bacterium]